MTAKEIIEGMAYTPWEKKTGNIFGNSGFHVMGYFAKSPTDCANAHAITTAVNATYGKGINPESIPAMLEILQDISDGNTWNVSDINNILNTAKIK